MRSWRSARPAGKTDRPGEMDHERYSDAYLRDILDDVRIIAMVGASQHWNRPSYFALKYLQDKRFRVIAVNP